MANLTKRDIVFGIYDKKKFNQGQVRQTVQMTLDIIARTLASGKNVELRGFGSFEPQVRKSRVCRNPKKPEIPVIIPRRVVIKFKAGKSLKAEMGKLDPDALLGR